MMSLVFRGCHYEFSFCPSWFLNIRDSISVRILTLRPMKSIYLIFTLLGIRPAVFMDIFLLTSE